MSTSEWGNIHPIKRSIKREVMIACMYKLVRKLEATYDPDDPHALTNAIRRAVGQDEMQMDAPYWYMINYVTLFWDNVLNPGDEEV
jgi:hypothetical protein